MPFVILKIHNIPHILQKERERKKEKKERRKSWVLYKI